MPIITLTSDWQRDSIYLIAIKAKILSICPETNIVDLSHNIATFNIARAAFIVKSSYKNFPENTIHIIAVKSEADAEQKYLIVKYKEQYFISNDNGIFGLIFDEPVEKIVKINTNFVETTFPTLDIFAETACKIATDNKIEEIGKLIPEFNMQFPFRPTTDANSIQGKIVYIDAYKNVISNISKELFEQTSKKRKFIITIKASRNKIKKINKNYYETESGEILAIFNSLGLLEIAMYNGKIAELLSLDLETVVRVDFLDLKLF